MSPLYKALILNIQTKGYDLDSRSKYSLIIYKLYYKALTASLNPRCLMSPPLGKTLIFQANDEHPSTKVPMWLA